jgi:two-component sensor histidine kinase
MRGKRIDRNQSGRYFYPLGARDGATGIALSVCAPFEMNENRSDLVAPEASSWNRWLLDQAIAAVQELLIDDWFVRFGADAYLALFHSKPSPDMLLAQALHEYLSDAACWPTRARHTSQPTQPVFAKASDLVVPAIKALDGILRSNRYLDDRLERSATLREVLHACGARLFTVNSLVRLRCAGEDDKGIKTRVKKDEEANYYYTDFSARLKSLETQHMLAVALDTVERWLSPENKADLRSTPTTLAADGSLAPGEKLQAIGPEIEQISPVPHSQRLHPALLSSKVLVKLAQHANPGVWVRGDAARATKGTIGEQEREALYRYIIKHGTQLSREVRRALRSAPVLRDQHDSWVAPGRVIIPTVKGVDQLRQRCTCRTRTMSTTRHSRKHYFFEKRSRAKI